jgi:hypothetical protein
MTIRKKRLRDFSQPPSWWSISLEADGPTVFQHACFPILAKSRPAQFARATNGKTPTLLAIADEVIE